MTMRFDSLEAFRVAVSFLSPEDAETLRARLVAGRLDPRYQDRVTEALALREFADGMAYTGYLWDYLADKEVVGEKELWRRVQAHPLVYALWDRHSAEHVSIPDYFKFPNQTVIHADPETLRLGLEYLPEDLYICDDSCEWVAALTHEVVDGQRFCLWSGRRR